MIGLKCELCGHEEKYNLKYHLEECHKISAKSYRKQYPKSRTMTGHSKRTLEYWVYRGYSLEEAKNAVKAFQKLGKTTYMQRRQDEGYTVEEAQQAWNMSQRVNSPRCVDYYLNKGLSDLEAYSRQSQYQKQLSAKSRKFRGKQHSESVKTRISESMKLQAKKVGYDKMISRFGEKLVGPRSKGEKECFQELKNLLGNIQASVYVEPYIADMLVGSNLIVEYYGDYWHRNPKYYQAADLVGEHTAEQIWEKDRKRLEYLQSKGYVTYVIWEHDWRTRRESIKTELKKLYESTNSYKTD